MKLIGIDDHQIPGNHPVLLLIKMESGFPFHNVMQLQMLMPVAFEDPPLGIPDISADLHRQLRIQKLLIFIQFQLWHSKTSYKQLCLST